MNIEIQIPRPGVLILAIAAVSGWSMYFAGFPPVNVESAANAEIIGKSAFAPAQGAAQAALTADPASNAPSPAAPVFTPSGKSSVIGLTPAEMRMKWARAQQQFIAERESILREQLSQLQKEREAMQDEVDPAMEEQFRQSVRLLTSLVKDREKAEQFLLNAYRQLWEAEEAGIELSSLQEQPAAPVSLQWPVEPAIGISAGFLDDAYESRFHLKHYGIDIPVLQGTDVLAAAPGVIRKVVNHGYGVNFVLIESDGFTSAYLHLSEIRVQVGQRVRIGDVIGLSGGRPGTRGAGFSTGPHLHFAMYVNGSPMDPLQYLPEYRG